MWDKLSFRIKITAIFTLSLTVLTMALTALFMMNATQNIAIPMQRGIQSFARMIVMPDEALQPDQWPESGYEHIYEHIINHLTEEQLEELTNHLYSEGGFHVVTGQTSEGTMVLEGSGIYTVGELLEHLDVSQDDFMQYGLWIAGLVIGLGSLVAYLVSGVIMQPIKALSTSVTNIEAEKLDVSLPLPKSRDEISQLTVSFNGMLDKLHRSFESKQLFAQNAAHELKTPLAIVRAHMEALKMDDHPTMADYEEVFDEVKNNTERMIELVEGLLAMGKSSTDADMTVFEGRETFEGIFSDLKGVIQSKNLNVQLLGETTIKGEKTLLVQAFFNLIANAIRYNVEGGNIVVTLSENQITIDDTGIGIPPESIGQLFDPFYCVDKSRSKHLGGNGLGLAITKNILNAHQMSIDVTSVVGVGTTIAIQI